MSDDQRRHAEAALRDASERLVDRPGDDAAQEARARALLTLGRLDEAEEAASAAVRLDPDEVRYRELLAEVLSAAGAHREAAGEYARLSHNDPRQRAWTLAEAGERLDAADGRGAAEAARRAVRLEPTDHRAQLALARALIQAGDARGALQAADAASRLRPDDAEAREALADARWLAGRWAEAFNEFRALAAEHGGETRRRSLTKARALYAQQASWVGRLLLAVPGLFPIALERGWARVR